MQEISPCSVSFVPFTFCPKPETNSGNISVFGGISRDGTWSWVVNDSFLEVFSVKTKEKCSRYNFGAKLKCSLPIMAIKEFSSPHISFPCLILGLDTSDGGLLCIYNVKTSKVISAIQLPYKVTSLEIISGVGGATEETHMLHKQLRYLFGIVAVGTEGGNVLLVDLCLDLENYSDEVRPSNATLISKALHNVPARRELASTKKQHICIYLSENNHRSDTFMFQTQNSDYTRFSPGDVIVSALKYIRNLASLAVGFNFGGIQLWNLQELNIEISIPIHSTQQPLVEFAFQEPENDPKNYCYLWAVRGHHQGENYRPENSTLATLYSFGYSKKEWISGYGFYYQNLESCTKKFEYVLNDDPYNITDQISPWSRLISCQVISNADVLANFGVDEQLQNEEEEWGCPDDFRLCLLSWENWPTTGGKPESSYIALFDINQWYQAQMPSTARCNYGEMCSYLGVFSLNEVSKKINLDSIMAFAQVPNSMTRFKCQTDADELFFPSSLSFKTWCLSYGGITQASFLGTQRQLLAEMSYAGPNVLISPKELFNRCVSVGLVNPVRGSAKKLLSVDILRESLLSLALEQGLMQFLIACVLNWKNSAFIHSGCSAKFILDWCWKIVTQIKNSTDNICKPLFNCAGEQFSKESLRMLQIFKSRLKYLSDILSTFQSMTIPQTEQGQLELQMRKEAVDSIAVYLQILIWLYDCKLLPEHAEGEEFSEDEVAYPTMLLNKTHTYRRAKSRQLCSSMDDGDILEGILVIDGLVEEFGDPLVQMWEQKGGTRSYPPPSIYAAASSYLISDIVLSKKHMLMYYLILDLSAYLTHRQSHLLEKLTMFCSSNKVSAGLSKLTQAFWHLDHQDFETAIVLFMDPTISDADIVPWQYTMIVKSLLYQEQPEKALKFINTRKPPDLTNEQIKLHLSVFLSNGLVADAFFYVRRYQGDRQLRDLLTHLFLGCQQTHNLVTLLQLPLNSVESSALSTFLSTCGDPKAAELLVMFHLLRCQPLEAAVLNEKLNTQVIEQDSQGHDRAAARNALVAGFLESLPDTQKQLAQEVTQMGMQVDWKEANEPLSVSINRQSVHVVSYADVLKKVIDKHEGDNEKKKLDPETPFRSWKQSISTTPFIRSAITPRQRKRNLSPDDSLMGKSAVVEYNEHTPAKRARLFDSACFSLSGTKRKLKTPLQEGLISLLQTPPVTRSSARSRTSFIVETAVTEVVSILKRPSIVATHYSPTPSCPKTPSVCSEMSKDEEMSGSEAETNKPEDLPPRQLRFTESTPLGIFQSSMQKPTPRRPLHSEVEPATVSNDDEMSVERDVFISSTNVVEGESSQHFLPLQRDDLNSSCAMEDFTLHHCKSKVETNDDSCSNDVVVLSNESEEEDEGHFLTPDVSFNSPKGTYVHANFQSDDLGIDDHNLSFKSLKSMENMQHTILKEDSGQLGDVNDEIFVDVELPSENLIAYEENENSENSNNVDVCMSSNSRSRSQSPSRTSEITSVPKPIALYRVAELNAGDMCALPDEFIVPSLDMEILQPPALILEVREESSNSSCPYLGTRSRSRSESVSPSRSSRSSSRGEIPSSTSLLTSTLEVPKNDTSYSNDSTPLREAELLQPTCTTTGKHESPKSSHGHGTRSESVSPSRRNKHLSVTPVVEVEEQEKYANSSELNPCSQEKSPSFHQNTPSTGTINTDISTKVYSANMFATKAIAQTANSNATTEVSDIPKITTAKVKDRTKNLTGEKETIKIASVSKTRQLPKTSTKKKDKQKNTLSGVKDKVIKKNKNDKMKKKLEFSFSDPHSPAGKEILQALSSSPNIPVQSFIFSPPVTRARERRINATPSTPAQCDSSLLATNQPAAPLEEGSNYIKKAGVSSQSNRQKKTNQRNEKLGEESSEKYLKLISPVVTTAEDGVASPLFSMAKHTMVLRKTKKTVKLFN